MDRELIKQALMPDASEAEVGMMVAVCERTGLDPFARQLYAVRRREGNAWRTIVQISIDGLRVVAERSGKYEGQTMPAWCGPDGKWVEVWLSTDPPAAARVGVYRTGFREPMCAVARYESFCQRDAGGQPVRLWRTMPDVMVAKCAEAQALRRAFPALLSGLYAPEEMAQAEPTQPSLAEPPTGLAVSPFGDLPTVPLSERAVGRHVVEAATTVKTSDEGVSAESKTRIKQAIADHQMKQEDWQAWCDAQGVRPHPRTELEALELIGRLELWETDMESARVQRLEDEAMQAEAAARTEVEA